MAFDRYRKAREASEVNLIPVMNLFVVMIPFLLLSAAFLHVGVIPTSLPTQADGDGDVAVDLLSVTVNLQLDKDAIYLSASNPDLDPEVLAALGATIPATPEGPDVDTLNETLHAIKTEYTRSDTVVLLTATGVPYKDVVRVLDAARDVELQAAGDGKDAVTQPLFPVAVLSKKVESEETQ